VISITALDHVQLAMPRGEEAAARAFYGQLLGLSELPKPPALASRGGCWFALPNGQALHLGVEEPFAPARKAHPAFVVADLAACEAAIVAAGITVIPDTALPDVRRFYASDPFGNRIEFIERGT
jgi:catechol 2,3-dioxygenase-like lactoylglutathione lyase family enzyme